MRISLKQINYFYLAVVLLWHPIQISLSHIDDAGVVPFFLTIIVFLINYLYDAGFKLRLISKPLIYWGIWVIYSAVNLIIQHYQKENYLPVFFIRSLFMPFLVMVLASKETLRDRKGILQLLSVIFIIYAVLSVTVLGGENPFDSDRGLGALWNLGPLTSLFIIFFLSLLYVNGWISLPRLIPLILFVFVVIALGGTRKAFGAALIIVLGLILSQFKLSAKNIIIFFLLSGLTYIGYSYTMNNTSMGARFEEGLEAGERYNTSNIKLLNLVGDRAQFYINGWSLFSENPLTGVGLLNYRRETGSILNIHSEYMVQLAEGGVIGTILFLLFNIGIGKLLMEVWRRYPRKRPIAWVLIGGYSAILFINITAWTYSLPFYFMVFGVIIGYVQAIDFESKVKANSSR